MAGRPRLYENAAEKNRAYRARQAERLVLADRLTFEEAHADLRALTEAVREASQAGDPLARALSTITRHDLLHSLAEHFRQRARDLGHSRTATATGPSRRGGRRRGRASTSATTQEMEERAAGVRGGERPRP